MEIKRIIVPPFDTNCYLVSEAGYSVIIDPGGGETEIINMLEKTPEAILLTHGHFDHTGAVAALKARLNIPVYVHKDDAFMLKGADESHAARFGFPFSPFVADHLFTDEDVLSFGPITFSVLHTPGHTIGSVCFYQEGTLFSGDTLFLETIGKFDYQHHQQMALSLEKLAKLPQDTVVYPGHGDVTTIGHEKDENPYLQADWKWGL